MFMSFLIASPVFDNLKQGFLQCWEKLPKTSGTFKPHDLSPNMSGGATNGAELLFRESPQNYENQQTVS